MIAVKFMRLFQMFYVHEPVSYMYIHNLVYTESACRCVGHHSLQIAYHTFRHRSAGMFAFLGHPVSHRFFPETPCETLLFAIQRKSSQNMACSISWCSVEK